jgi:hypothetical protein
VSSREAGKHFAVCEQIMRDRPRWFVAWGPVTRVYWAFPRFETPTWLLVIFDPDPKKLAARMDESERLFGRRQTGRGGGQEC